LVYSSATEQKMKSGT